MKLGTKLERFFNAFVIVLVVFGILYFSIRAFAGVAHQKIDEQYMRNCGFDTVVIKLEDYMVNEDMINYVKIKGEFREHKLLKHEKRDGYVIFTLVRDTQILK